MRIIHCADLHLDSKMTANLDSKKAKERKIELLNTFKSMIDYASSNDVRAIIIAGDLFDKKVVTKTASNTVYQAMIDNPDIVFYYLKGNHDEDTFLDEMDFFEVEVWKVSPSSVSTMITLRVNFLLLLL